MSELLTEPNPNSILVANVPPLFLSGLPSPASNPSFGLSTESLLNDLFDPDSPHESRPLPLQPLPLENPCSYLIEAPLCPRPPTPSSSLPSLRAPPNFQGQDIRPFGQESAGDLLAPWGGQKFRPRGGDATMEPAFSGRDLRREGGEQRQAQKESPDAVVRYWSAIPLCAVVFICGFAHDFMYLGPPSAELQWGSQF